MNYTIKMTDVFKTWAKNMKDAQARNAIFMRIKRFQLGNFGDSKTIASNLYEMRVFVGKGYRVYYTIQDKQIVLLMNGGHKGTQTKDIDNAKRILKELENTNDNQHNIV
jgi:putative addiction module killer protein